MNDQQQQERGSNGSHHTQLESFLAEIDKADDELLSLKSDHMAACKGPRGRIRLVLKRAREDGTNMKALQATISKHRSERKINQQLAELEADDHAEFVSMQEALGEFADTPLGASAVERARPKGEQLDGLAAKA